MPSILFPRTGITIDSSLRSAASLALNAAGSMRVLFFGRFLEHRAVPDQVVGNDDGSRARQLHAQIQIGRVARLVGVDEDQIEGRALADR